VAYFEKPLLNLNKDGSSLVQAVQNVVDELRGVEDTPRLPTRAGVRI
jgi:hypothetical protein